MTEIESMLLSALERLSEETKEYLQKDQQRQAKAYEELNNSLSTYMSALDSESNSINELVSMNKSLVDQNFFLKDQLKTVEGRLKMLETDFPKQMEQLVEQLAAQQIQLGKQVEQLAQQQTQLSNQLLRLNLS